MDNPTLACNILINQRGRNKSIGINNDPQFLRGMVAYIGATNEKQIGDAMRHLAKASYLKAMIEEHVDLADRLVAYITANIEDDEIRRDGLVAMTKLESYINHLGTELEAIL